jgi:hypothetical protein
LKKHDLILRLLSEGKTYRDICHIAHTSPRDIKPIAKEYERKKRLETKNGEQKNRAKKRSISTQSFMLFKQGKQIDEVKVLLDIPFKLAYRYCKQYLKAIGMFEAFEFYQDHSYDIPRFLSINIFMKRNNISGNDVGNILREANDVDNLKQIISNLKTEIEKLKQTKNNYSLYQNMQPVPLGPLPAYYNW